MRIAWFSPLPPSRSGIAAYSADLLPLLAERHEIDAYIDGMAAPGFSTPAEAAAGQRVSIGGAAVRDAHEFLWRHATRPYDLVVYQLGNDICHDYMWPYMVRHAGLVVIHDAQLHQARAKGLIWRQHRADDYRAEFRYSHPDTPADVAELVVAGLGGTVCRLWPMLRVPVEAARVVAVHNARVAADLREQFPAARIASIRMGVPDPSPSAVASPAAVRARHDIPDEAVVFAAYGRVTPEKRITQVMQALAGVAAEVPRARLLLVGDSANDDVLAEASALGIVDRVIVTGYVADEQLPEYLAVADVCLCLRWPTSGETSASWLRCLAAGKPTIITDLRHLAEVPCLDPRSMRLSSARATDQPAAEPVGMAVELIDEVSALRMSIRQLAQDADLRARLGRAAREYWSQQAALSVMVQDYEAALASAAGTPFTRPPDWPEHLTADGTSHARAVAASIGVALDWL